jgi:hypothetical protein
MTDTSHAPATQASDTPVHDIVAGLVSFTSLPDNVLSCPSFSDASGCYIEMIGVVPVVHHNTVCPGECFVSEVAGRASHVAVAHAHAFENGFVTLDSATHLVLDEIAEHQRELTARARGHIAAAMADVSHRRAALSVEQAQPFGTAVGVATVDSSTVVLGHDELAHFHLVHDPLNRRIRLLCDRCWPEVDHDPVEGWEASALARAIVSHRYAHPAEDEA